MTLREANRLVAHLGGFAGRRRDGEPGAESVGIGMRRLMDMTCGWRLREEFDESRPKRSRKSV